MDNYQNYGTVNNEDSDDSDGDYLFGVQEKENVRTVKSKQPRLNLTINGLNVQMLADTGSSIKMAIIL